MGATHKLERPLSSITSESDLSSVPGNRVIIHGIPGQDSLRLPRGDFSDPQFGPSCLDR